MCLNGGYGLCFRFGLSPRTMVPRAIHASLLMPVHAETPTYAWNERVLAGSLKRGEGDGSAESRAQRWVGAAPMAHLAHGCVLFRTDNPSDIYYQIIHS